MEEKQSKLFDKYEAFFAFSTEQFNKSKKENIKYIRMESGLICPSENAIKLIEEMDSVYREAIKQDMAEHSIEDIIHRDFANYEVQISGDYSQVIEELKEYGINEEKIRAEYKKYYKNCIKNDWF